MNTAYGVMATFDGPEALLVAAARTRDAGFERFDVHTPFPVHGMDDAMGMRRSKLGWIVAASAVTGFLTGLGLQWYANVYAYPLITQGKPYFSWQAFVPVCFELTILFSAFGAVFGMFALNGLPDWYHPVLKTEAGERVSDDKFILVIEANDPRFDLADAKDHLLVIGGRDISTLEA